MITYDKAIELVRPYRWDIDGRKRYDVLRGVTKALSTDETRWVLQYIKVDKETIVATDGRRVHLCDNLLELPEGLWKPVINRVKNMVLLPCMDETAKYPNYKQVIPVMHGYDKITEHEDLTYVLGHLGKADCFASLEYMRDATDKKTSCPDGYSVHVNDELSPIVVLGQACGYKGIVMPLRRT